MIETWCTETTGEYQAASNIAIHMPDGVIGVDVDHYGDKRGGDTLATLEAELGKLPNTYKSTSRPDDKVSAIRWYRVEPGMRWPSGPGKDIEFIHSGHRYAVVWPSIHPDTHNEYVWIDYNGSGSDPPEPDQLAELPWEWVARFTGGEMRQEQDFPNRKATDEERATCLTDGPICYAATKALNKFKDRLLVQARHDSARDTVMALVRLGEQGHKGINSATAELKDAFANKVSKDRADGSEDAEFERFVDGGVVKVLAAPTPEENKRCCSPSSKQQEETQNPKPGGRWTNLDQYLDGTYTPPQPTIGAARTTASNSSTRRCGTPTSPSPRQGKPPSHYGKPKRSSTGAATSSTSTSKKPTPTASSTGSEGSASTPRRYGNGSIGDMSTPREKGESSRSRSNT
jgi:hypothetical protein